MLVFEERGKPEYLDKKMSEQRGEPTNSTHIWSRVWQRARATFVGRECSHCYVIPTPISGEIDIHSSVNLIHLFF